MMGMVVDYGVYVVLDEGGFYVGWGDVGDCFELGFVVLFYF